MLSVVVGCMLGVAGAFAQPSLPLTNGIHVGIDWHTIADPRYGASFDYAWNDAHVRSGNGADIPAAIELEISNTEGGGLFTLLSRPVNVPSSGMILTFDNHVIMHPTDAERGTSLPNNPKDKCKNFKNGASRAIFHQVVSIIDAETGKSLIPVANSHQFEVSRFQTLNDIDDHNTITIDLSNFSGKQVRIRTIVLASYNGRGPSSPTTPTLSTDNQTIHQDLE
jgi:hypothetical protein